MTICSGDRKEMIGKAIFDSGIFIGSLYNKDQYREEATEILEGLASGHIRKVYITDYVMLECVNFLLMKVGFEKANATLIYLTETERWSR